MPREASDSVGGATAGAAARRSNYGAAADVTASAEASARGRSYLSAPKGGATDERVHVVKDGNVITPRSGVAVKQDQEKLIAMFLTITLAAIVAVQVLRIFNALSDRQFQLAVGALLILTGITLIL